MSTNAAVHLPPTPPSEPTSSGNHMATTTTTAGQDKHIWIITGPAGCGKTSVAEYLHTQLSLPYLEGDTFHTPENVKKMSEGQPLTDTDRWDWLILLREEALKALSMSSATGVIVTCSALKRKYRDVLRVASYHHPSVKIHFVFLQASESVLMDRVRARQNHYMKDYMVHSQFQSLEAPQEDELAKDVFSVDASGESKEVQRLALEVVHKVVG